MKGDASHEELRHVLSDLVELYGISPVADVLGINRATLTNIILLKTTITEETARKLGYERHIIFRRMPDETTVQTTDGLDKTS